MYYCPQVHKDHVSPDCPHAIGSKRADQIVWERVSEVINRPEMLLSEAHRMVGDLRANADLLDIERKRVEDELDALALERQWVITQARKGAISESDMDYQLGAMNFQELGLKRDLSSIEQVVNINSLGDWETEVREYLADLRAGLESLNTEPGSEEERKEIFEVKRQAVTTLVSRITIDRNRELHVEISLNLLALLEDRAGFEGHQINDIAS